MQDQIIQLETLSALQDETIQSLHRELFRQQQDIMRLQQRLEQLEQKLKDLQNPPQIAGSEKPPHY